MMEPDAASDSAHKEPGQPPDMLVREAIHRVKVGGFLAGVGIPIALIDLDITNSMDGYDKWRLWLGLLVAFIAWRLVVYACRGSRRVFFRKVFGYWSLVFALAFWVNIHGHAGGWYQRNYMRQALREVEAYQDSVHARTGRFSATMPASERWTFIGKDIRLTPDGWTAEASLDRFDRRCVMFVGRSPIPPATEPREVRCTRGRFDWWPVGWLSIALLGILLALSGARMERTGRWSTEERNPAA